MKNYWRLKQVLISINHHLRLLYYALYSFRHPGRLHWKNLAEAPAHLGVPAPNTSLFRYTEESLISTKAFRFNATKDLFRDGSIERLDITPLAQLLSDSTVKWLLEVLAY